MVAAVGRVAEAALLLCTKGSSSSIEGRKGEERREVKSEPAAEESAARNVLCGVALAKYRAHEQRQGLRVTRCRRRDAALCAAGAFLARALCSVGALSILYALLLRLLAAAAPRVVPARFNRSVFRPAWHWRARERRCDEGERGGAAAIRSRSVWWLAARVEKKCNSTIGARPPSKWVATTRQDRCFSSSVWCWSVRSISDSHVLR